MSNLLNAIKNTASVRTENGDAAYSTTNSAVLDFSHLEVLYVREPTTIF